MQYYHKILVHLNEVAKEQTERWARAQNSSGYAISDSSSITTQEKNNKELLIFSIVVVKTMQKNRGRECHLQLLHTTWYKKTTLFCSNIR